MYCTFKQHIDLVVRVLATKLICCLKVQSLLINFHFCGCKLSFCFRTRNKLFLFLVTIKCHIQSNSYYSTQHIAHVHIKFYGSCHNYMYVCVCTLILVHVYALCVCIHVWTCVCVCVCSVLCMRMCVMCMPA